MIPLIRKELRQLLPIFLLFAALSIIELLAIGIGTSFGAASWATDCSIGCLPGNRAFSAISTMFISFVIAYSLYPHEHDSGTINFLRAMPVARSTIFFAKFLAGVLLVVSISFIGYLRWMLVISTNSSSLTGGIYPGLTTTFFIQDAVGLCIFLAYGMWLSTMRTFGFVLIFAAVIALIMLDRARLHSFMDPLELFRIQFSGQNQVLPWAAMLFQGLLAVVALRFAYVQWSHIDAWGSSQNLNDKRQKLKTGVMLAVAFGVALLAGSGFVQKNPTESEYTGPVETRVTDHYRFVFPDRAALPAQVLIKQADGLYDSVSSAMGAETKPKIRVDLTQRSQHFAGLARWKSFRMDISRPSSRLSHEFVLTHETAHVIQSTESQRGMRQHWNAVQFFIEGSAEYIAHQIVNAGPQRKQDIAMAAATVAGENFTFADLTNGSKIKATYDTTLLYGLGDLWSEALVETCGSAAIGDAVRAFAGSNIPKSTTGEDLWRRVLSSFDCSLIDVNNKWQQSMAAAIDDGAHTFPALGGMAIQQLDNGRYQLRLELDGTAAQFEEGRFSIRILRDSAVGNEPDDQFSGVFSEDEKELSFRVPAYAFTSDRFRYQVSWRHDDATVPFLYKTRAASVP